MNFQKSTVFVIDDDASVCKALERVLRATGLDVQAYASAPEYLARFDPDAAGCLVLDLSMPGFSGFELQDALRARGGGPPIVFVSGQADVPDGVRAMKCGAVEFLTKPVDAAVLIDAVRKAIEKDRIERTAHAELAEVHRRLATLTRRESQVLRCVVAGRLNKQTAGELGTVEKTVKVHRACVMRKMQAKSLAELVQLAVRAGIASQSGV